MKLPFLVPACAAACLVVSSAQAQIVVAADWLDDGKGTVDGLPFTAPNFAFQLLTTADFSGSDYAFAPLSATQEALEFSQGAGAENNVFLSAPVSGLLLYARNWNAAPIDGASRTFTFNTSFEIVSGFAGAQVNGTQLILAEPTNYGGILAFPDNTSHVAFPNNSFLVPGAQFTIAVIPEPETMALLASVGLVGVGVVTRIRRARP
jgi:hypothetical protein